MALQINRKYRGIPLPQAYVRIERIFGGKKENGWQAVMGVHANAQEAAPIQTQDPLPEFMKADKSAEEIAVLQAAMPVKIRYPEPLETFNSPIFKYVPGEDPYVTVYNGLKGTDEFQGATEA